MYEGLVLYSCGCFVIDEKAPTLSTCPIHRETTVVMPCPVKEGQTFNSGLFRVVSDFPTQKFDRIFTTLTIHDVEIGLDRVTVKDEFFKNLKGVLAKGGLIKVVLDFPAFSDFVLKANMCGFKVRPTKMRFLKHGKEILSPNSYSFYSVKAVLLLYVGTVTKNSRPLILDCHNITSTKFKAKATGSFVIYAPNYRIFKQAVGLVEGIYGYQDTAGKEETHKRR